MEEIKRRKRELVYQGAVLNVYRDQVELPNGNVAEWDYIHHDGAAAVVPVTEDGKIRLTYNDTEELIIDKDKMSQMRLHFSF